MIADRIRELREQRGLTQSELARQLGITRSSVNAWEMGISIPSTQYVVELAHLFKVTTDYLLCVDAATINVSGLTEEDTNLLLRIVAHLRDINQR